MIQRDYVLRLIEQLVQALHYSLGLTRSGEYEKALEALDEAFGSFFGWDTNFVNSMPESYLVDLLRSGPRLDAEQVTVLAVLIKNEGDVYEAKGEMAKAYHRHLRALNLFLIIAEKNVPNEMPEEWDQTSELLDKLAAYQLPPETLYRLWRYFAATGHYARAEDTLWQLLALPGEEERVIEEGIRFYHSLLTKSDSELRTGGLPRVEIEEALQELQERGVG